MQCCSPAGTGDGAECERLLHAGRRHLQLLLHLPRPPPAPVSDYHPAFPVCRAYPSVGALQLWRASQQFYLPTLCSQDLNPNIGLRPAQCPFFTFHDWWQSVASRRAERLCRLVLSTRTPCVTLNKKKRHRNLGPPSCVPAQAGVEHPAEGGGGGDRQDCVGAAAKHHRELMGLGRHRCGPAGWSRLRVLKKKEHALMWDAASVDKMNLHGCRML